MIQWLTGADQLAVRCWLTGWQVLIKQLIKRLTGADQAAVLRLTFEEVPRHRDLSWVDAEIGVFQNVAQTTRLSLEFQCETGLLLKWDGKVGIPFQTKQGNRPSYRDQRGEGAQNKLCWETQCSSGVRPVCRGTLWVALWVSSTVSYKKARVSQSEKTIWRCCFWIWRRRKRLAKNKDMLTVSRS